MEDSVGYLQSRWESLKSRNRWTCVEDEADFLAEVYRRCEQPPEDLPLAHLHLILLQAYSRYVYDCLRQGLAGSDTQDVARRLDRALDDLRAYAERKLPVDYPQAVVSDLVQEVLLRLITRYESIRKPESLMAWINNQILDLTKRHNHSPGNRELRSSDGIDLAAVEASGPQLDDAIMARDLYELLQSILSAFQLQVIIFYFWEGKKPADIAALLRVSVDRVRVEKSRALAKMRASQRLLDLLER